MGASRTREEEEEDRKVKSNQSINTVDLVGRTEVVPEERQNDDGKVGDMIRQMNINVLSGEDNLAATDDKDNYFNGEKEQKVGDDVVGQKEQEGEVANVEMQMNDEGSREEGMTRKYHGVKGDLEEGEEGGQNQRDKPKKREVIVVDVVDEAGQNQRDKARKREDIVVDVDHVLENGTEGDVMSRKDAVVTDRDGDNNERKRNRDGAAKTKPGRIIDDTGDGRTAKRNGGELKTIQVEVAKLGEDCDVTTMSQTNHSKSPSSVHMFQNRLTDIPEETTTCFCFKSIRGRGEKRSEHDKGKKMKLEKSRKGERKSMLGGQSRKEKNKEKANRKKNEKRREEEIKKSSKRE